MYLHKNEIFELLYKNKLSYLVEYTIKNIKVCLLLI